MKFIIKKTNSNFRKVECKCPINKNELILKEFGFYISEVSYFNKILICGNCGTLSNLNKIDSSYSCIYCNMWFCNKNCCKHRYRIHQCVCSKLESIGDYDNQIPINYRFLIELTYYSDLCKSILNTNYNNYNCIFPKKYLYLINSDIKLTSKQINRLLGILYTNQFESTYPIITELFNPNINGILLATKYGHLFNHSCKPNAYFYAFGNKLIIKSLKKISKGEEITISYIGIEELLNKPDFKKKFNFNCICNNHIDIKLSKYMRPTDGWIQAISESYSYQYTPRKRLEIVQQFTKSTRLKQLENYILNLNNIQYIDQISMTILHWIIYTIRKTNTKMTLNIIQLLENKVIFAKKEIQKLIGIDYILSDIQLYFQFIKSIINPKTNLNLFKNTLKLTLPNTNYLPEFNILANNIKTRNICKLL